MPPRTSMVPRSVAPVKSSAMQPSSMASSSRWRECQYVAVTDAYGKSRRASPGEVALPASAVIAAACDGMALRAASAAPSIKARCMRSAVRGTRQSRRRRRCHEAACGKCIRATDGAASRVPAEPLVAPLVASERRTHQCVVTDDAAARHRDRRPSGMRGMEHAACRTAARATLQTPDRAARCTATASADPAVVMAAMTAQPARSRSTACIRHSPCGVETSNASPGAVAAKPCRRAHAAVRPNASSSSAASASTRIQSCLRPMIGARKRNRLPVPAPRSTRRGRAGSRSARRRASATLRAAWSNGSRSLSQSDGEALRSRRQGLGEFPRLRLPARQASGRPATPLPPSRDAGRRRRSAAAAPSTD